MRRIGGPVLFPPGVGNWTRAPARGPCLCRGVSGLVEQYCLYVGVCLNGAFQGRRSRLHLTFATLCNPLLIVLSLCRNDMQAEDKKRWIVKRVLPFLPPPSSFLLPSKLQRTVLPQSGITAQTSGQLNPAACCQRLHASAHQTLGSEKEQ